jgi:hypothetical protein
MTNFHVLNDAAQTDFCTVILNYELDEFGRERRIVERKLRKGILAADRDLDYCIFEISEPAEADIFVPPLQTKPPQVDDRVNIIQHPGGMAKQVSIQNNFVSFVGGDRLHYITATQPGSSGSPVFNDDWEVVGLHRAGGWIKREAKKSNSYFENQGVLIRSILESLPPEINKRIIRAG